MARLTTYLYEAQSKQTLHDIALECYGSAAGIVWLLADNRLPRIIQFNPSAERYTSPDQPDFVSNEQLEKTRARYLGYGPSWLPEPGMRLKLRDDVIDAYVRDQLVDYAPFTTAP